MALCGLQPGSRGFARSGVKVVHALQRTAPEGLLLEGLHLQDACRAQLLIRDCILIVEERALLETTRSSLSCNLLLDPGASCLLCLLVCFKNDDVNRVRSLSGGGVVREGGMHP